MKAEAAGKRTPVRIFPGRYRFPPRLKKKILTLAKRIATGEKKSFNTSMIFIGDAKMKELNSRFRGKNKTTDVLSFPIEANGKKVEGEIYISLPQARRQAALFGNKAEGEILRLSAHGFLHLLGYDHEDDAKAEAMEGLEIKILAGLGVENPY